VIPYQLIRSYPVGAIIFANKELAAAPEQNPTQFRSGADVENLSLISQA
jgi:hypothetical protein